MAAPAATRFGVTALVCAIAALAACGDRHDAPPPPAAALGLPPLPGVPPSAAQVELGRQLFFDRRLSFNGTMSCAMCHVPEEGFASNASRLAVGIEGRSLRRNAPTVLNVAWVRELFHDGREPSLDAQAWSPLLHPHEMANPSPGHVIGRIRALPEYAGRFERAFDGRGPSMDTVGAALAAYERSLVAAGSRFDRWRYGGDAQALTPLEQRGFELFTGAARCAACHHVGERDAPFTDHRYHATGVGFVPGPARLVVPLAPGVQTVLEAGALTPFADPRPPDLGRFEVTLDPADRHAFRTPSLRNVARTAPYMHDGSLATLDDVVDFYDRGGGDLEGKSPLLAPLGLTGDDKRALVAFLRALDSAALPALVEAARRPLADGR
ncbi:cytochrome-c peroxidase [Azohydromonas sediminis]|uniref:cytochrome-c peroxidase n=1 Tax=Azohydromonas sediminis TaxID=2259674 RepID=UPI000E65D520|nr:cytochrome c peroxidase [Azohydromonas sediminis]